MQLNDILDYLVIITNNKYFDLLLTFLESALPPMLVFLGSLLGGRLGFASYKKSKEYRWFEAQEFIAWKERDKVKIPESARQEFKDYFNKMVNELYKKKKTTARDAINDFPKKYDQNFKNSNEIKANWEAYIKLMREIADVVEGKGDRRNHGNNHDFVKKFTQAKTHWLIFMNLCFAEKYSNEEIAKLMDMGITEADKQEGKDGPDGTTQHHIV